MRIRSVATKLLRDLTLAALAVAVASGCARTRAPAPAPAGSPTAARRAGATADTAGVAGQVMDADRAFAAATAARGLDGWMSYFAPEAVALERMANPARGAAAIRARDSATFANPAMRLTWAPTDAGAFAGGGTGWTVGRYEIRRRAADGTESIAATGRYITLWRRGSDGRWLVTLDTGAPDR